MGMCMVEIPQNTQSGLKSVHGSEQFSQHGNSRSMELKGFNKKHGRDYSLQVLHAHCAC